MKFRIRLDAIEGSKDTLNRLLIGSTEFVLVHHQINDNPHYHMFLDNSNYMSCQAVRYYLKKLTDKPSNYSVKQCDDDRVSEYIQYLFNTKHGNISTLEDYKLFSVDIQECQAKATQVAEEFAKRKPAPKSLYDIAMYVHETTPDLQDIIKQTIRALHKFCKCHDDYLVIKVVTTIMSLRDEEFVVERIRRKISQ